MAIVGEIKEGRTPGSVVTQLGHVRVVVRSGLIRAYG